MLCEPDGVVQNCVFMVGISTVDSVFLPAMLSGMPGSPELFWAVLPAIWKLGRLWPKCTATMLRIPV